MQYNEFHGFNFVLMLMCHHEPSMHPICHFAWKTWDLCNTVALKSRAWHSEKKACTFTSFGGIGGNWLWYIQIMLNRPWGFRYEKTNVYFTPVSLLRKQGVISLLGSIRTFHYLHGVPFFLFFFKKQSIFSPFLRF